MLEYYDLGTFVGNKKLSIGDRSGRFLSLFFHHFASKVESFSSQKKVARKET